MKELCILVLGALAGYYYSQSQIQPCPAPKPAVSYAPTEERATRILDAEDRVIWERN